MLPADPGAAYTLIAFPFLRPATLLAIVWNITLALVTAK